MLATGGLAVEFQVLRYEVSWPVGGSLAYVAPPWDAGSEPDLTGEQDITAWVERYSFNKDDGYLVSTATLHLVGDYDERVNRGTAFATTVDAIGSTYIDVDDSMGGTDYTEYYAVVTSGAAVGTTFRVASNTSTRLTIRDRNPALSNLAVGDGIKVSEMTALRAMDVVRIKEVWRSLDGTEEVAQTTVWTGFVDKVVEQFTRGRRYVANCRDAMKIADLELVNSSVEPDQIHVDRKALTLHTDAGGDPSDPVREYGDGAQGSQTTNWCISPAVRLWAVWGDASERRLRSKEALDVVEGEGIVRISGDYWAADHPDGLTKGGGVGVPTSIEAEYWRYAQAADVASETASAAGATYIDVTGGGMATDEHKNKTVIVRDGDAANKRYTVTTNSATRLTVSGGDPSADGVVSTDSIDIGDPNRLEDALRRVLVDVGFQDQQSGKPFYISSLAAPSPGPIYLPPLRYQTTRDRTKGLEVLQAILEFAPPNYQLHCAADMSVTGEQFTQAVSADWTFDVHTSQERQSGDRDTYTKVVALGQSALQMNRFARHHGTTISWYTAIASQYREATDLEDLIDNDARTPATKGYPGKVFFEWRSEASIFDEKHGWYLDLGADYTIGEIQLISPKAPYTLKQAQVWILYYGTDADVASPGTFNDANPLAGGWTQLTDEISPAAPLVLKADQFLDRTAATMRYLKVYIQRQALYHDVFNGLVKHGRSQIAVVCTEMRGYDDRSIVGTATLGVTSPFDTDKHKRMRNRVRDRTFVTPQVNPYLDSQAKADAWALAWLQERYREFAPVVDVGVRPDAAIGQTAGVLNLVTGEETLHLVKSVTHNHDGTASVVLVEYE